MKKVVVIVLVMMLSIGVQAKSNEPKYKIISNSHTQEDIHEMYEIKSQLLKDYKEWSQGVTNKHQVLADHQDDYNALYKQGVYTIVLGKGKGKILEGELKVNYCSSTKEIEKRSFLFDWLFS